MAEVFVLGQIVSGQRFSHDSLFCKWKLISGTNWKLLEGIAEGQTQLDRTCNLGVACWAHPIDLHFATKGIQGWPKLLLEIWHRDHLDRCSVVGYGVVPLPAVPGLATLRCLTWRPLGSFVDRLSSIFNGDSVQLTNDLFVHSSKFRQHLHTEPSGEVTLELQIVLRDFEKFGVETH